MEVCNMYRVEPLCIPASITSTSKKIYGVIGQPVMLGCTVEGTEPIIITWLTSGSPVIGDSVTTEGVLKFDNYRDNQAGDYTCEVSNDCSSSHNHFEISLVTASKLLDIVV